MNELIVTLKEAVAYADIVRVRARIDRIDLLITRNGINLRAVVLANGRLAAKATRLVLWNEVDLHRDITGLLKEHINVIEKELKPYAST
jgi:fructose-1,6-bisphosphatase